MIDVVATREHYLRHLAPIGRALERRGHDVRWVEGKRDPRPGTLVLVSSVHDARRRAPASRVVLCEHGAGQSYGDRGDSYAGAVGLDHVVLFLTPGVHVAVRWGARYPETPVESIGCPAIDGLLQEAAPRPTNRAPVVVVSGHWRCAVVPETMPAVEAYARPLCAAQTACGVGLAATVHPREAKRHRGLWERLGVTVIDSPDDAIRRADLLVADNTSLMYEAAACGVPVLALNDPRYRRGVEHGLRFWSHVPGLQCDEPEQLQTSILDALNDPPEARALRARAVEFAYRYRDGRSSERAVAAIERVL